MPDRFVATGLIDGIAVITMNRPPANAITYEFARDMTTAFDEAEASAAKAIVITGTGSFFSGGLDLRAIPSYSRGRQREFLEVVNRLIGRIYGFAKPVVAAVNGHAIAGAFVLVLTADYRVGSEGDARFGLTEARAGIPFPGAPTIVVRAELAPADVRYATLYAKHFGAAEAGVRGVVGSNAATMSTNRSGSRSATSISNTSIPENFLNKTALPSITGFDASGLLRADQAPVSIRSDRGDRAIEPRPVRPDAPVLGERPRCRGIERHTRRQSMIGERRRYPPEERRRQILKAAVPVFARSNFKRARVSDIADALGITEAAVYRHFPTKKALYIALLDRVHERILLFWETQAAAELGPIDALHAMGLAYFRRIVKQPDELKIHFQAISEADDREIALRLRKHHQSYREFVARLIERGIAEGSVREDVDPRTIGYLFDGAGVFMSLMKILSDRSLSEDQYERMAAQLLDPLRS